MSDVDDRFPSPGPTAVGPTAPPIAWLGEIEGVGADLLVDDQRHLRGSLADLGELVTTLGGDRVLLVADPVAIAAAGLGDELAAQLADRAVATFTAFSPNPSHDEVVAAARAGAAHRATVVVAVGGGSCLDVAKGAALAVATPEIAASLTRGEDLDRARALPIVAVPTTSGTGSEATHFAVVYVEGRKTSLAHPSLRPAAVVLDPRFHLAMPPRLAAVSGLDALAQAMESRWAVGATSTSTRYAAAAGPLVARHLERSVVSGDRAARVAVMVGAHLAGRAIDISTTTAAHALSYPITSRHGVPHGHAVALTLGWVARHNATADAASCLDPRGPAHVRDAVRTATSWLGVEPADAPEAVAALVRRLGLAATTGEAGITAESAEAIARSVDPRRLANNPVRLTTEAIVELLTATPSPPPPTSGAHATR